MNSILPSLTIFFVTVLTIASVGVIDLAAEETKVLYADDFADVEGFRSTNTNDSYEDSDQDRTREAHNYMSNQTVGGDYVITVHEDDKTLGPDKKPGVLALSFVSLPTDSPYSGFLYQGRIGRPIRIPSLSDRPTADELKRLKISFRYRASNQDRENVGLVVNCRIEVDIDDAYAARLDFGTLKAFSKWETFDATFAVATNHDAFLAAVKRVNNPTYKIVWGQHGEISEYQSGDTLLIDDVKVSIVD
ncbi:MAG: hypothetical protein HKN47_28735 [Pirellulaceae bacterium]|nr:hypothetical protein [Pirellulaceae bacterium]